MNARPFTPGGGCCGPLRQLGTERRRLTALVTGGSSGIGRAVAARLAECGADLLLTSEKEDDLREAKRLLERAHGARVLTVRADLAAPGGADRVFEFCEDRGIAIDVLVNCAGVYANAAEEIADADLAERLLRIHVDSLTRLCLRFGGRMIERRLGYILNVSSISAFFQDPSSLTYGPSKRYVLSFSKAIHADWKEHNVKVCCLIPGGVDTGFFEKNRVFVPSLVRSLLMPPERCAEIGLRALFKGRRTRLCGFAAPFHLALFWLMLRPRLYPAAKRAYARRARKRGRTPKG